MELLREALFLQECVKETMVKKSTVTDDENPKIGSLIESKTAKKSTVTKNNLPTVKKSTVTKQNSPAHEVQKCVSRGRTES